VKGLTDFASQPDFLQQNPTMLGLGLILLKKWDISKPEFSTFHNKKTKTQQFIQSVGFLAKKIDTIQTF
jgi:hypothetical protein